MNPCQVSSQGLLLDCIAFQCLLGQVAAMLKALGSQLHEIKSRIMQLLHAEQDRRWWCTWCEVQTVQALLLGLKTCGVLLSAQE